jgi:DNA-binding HxlR family transcriptional regulator
LHYATRRFSCWERLTTIRCARSRALNVIGERWSLLIIRNALFAGATRFKDFQRSLGVAPNILSSRLDAFISGIMERRTDADRPHQIEYVLTDKARDLEPALLALNFWGDRWWSPQRPPNTYEHSQCGSPIRQELTCADCGTATMDAVVVRPGPGSPVRATQAGD